MNGKYRQYTTNILCQKFALDSSFAIYVFMGDFDDTPSAWATSPNLVGTHAVFTGMTGAMGTVNGERVKVQQKPAIQVTGTMPLTSMLLAKVSSGELDNMNPDAVEEYLEAYLKWRISMVCNLPVHLITSNTTLHTHSKPLLTCICTKQFDGTPIAAGDVADLTVTVISAEVEAAASIDEFPSWSNFEKLTRITRGKPGGCA